MCLNIYTENKKQLENSYDINIDNCQQKKSLSAQ